MLDVYTFLAFLYTYTLTCIENNQIEFQHAWGLCLTLCTQHRKSVVLSRVGNQIRVSALFSLNCANTKEVEHSAL